MQDRDGCAIIGVGENASSILTVDRIGLTDLGAVYSETGTHGSAEGGSIVRCTSYSTKRDAHDAGVTAGKARQVIEADLGESVVSQSNHLALQGPTHRTKRDAKLTSSTKQRTDQPQQGDETQLSLFDDTGSPETTSNTE